MRIVDVSAFYSPQGGGVRSYVHRKLRAAPTLGHELIVLAPGPVDSITDSGDGAILHTIAARKLPVDHRYHYFDSEERLHAALTQWSPDHVEASSPWSSASMVARWNGAASRSLIMHADPLASYAYRWLGPIASVERIDRWCSRFWSHLRRLDCDYDVVVSASESLSKRLVGGGLRKTMTIPMGVEPNVFSAGLRSPTVRAEWLERLGLPADALFLLAVGRLSAEKRWPMVLRAVQRASRSRPVGLLVVGEGTQDKRIRRMVRGNRNIELAGPVRDRSTLASLMASADALVHGCESETFCLVASEARASGLPMIVPDGGGAFDQLRPGAGVSYAAGDERALADAIIAFRARDAAPGAVSAPLPVPRRDRTMDDHFLELFALYVCGLPLIDQLGDLAAQLGSLGALA